MSPSPTRMCAPCLCPCSCISLPEQGNREADGLADQMAKIFVRICRTRQDAPPAGGLLMYQVEVNTALLHAQVLSQLQGIRQTSVTEAAMPPIARVWIHAPFIDHAQPELVERFSVSAPRTLSDWVWKNAPAPVLARLSQLPLHPSAAIHTDSSTVVELSDSSSDATLSDSML